MGKLKKLGTSLGQGTVCDAKFCDRSGSERRGLRSEDAVLSRQPRSDVLKPVGQFVQLAFGGGVKVSLCRHALSLAPNLRRNEAGQVALKLGVGGEPLRHTRFAERRPANLQLGFASN